MNEHLYLCRNSTQYTKLNTEKKEMYKFMYLTLIEPIYTIKICLLEVDSNKSFQKVKLCLAMFFKLHFKDS